MTINKRPMVYIAHPMTARSGDKARNFEKNKKIVGEICNYMIKKIIQEEKEIAHLNNIIQNCSEIDNLDRDDIISKMTVYGDKVQNGIITPWFFAPQVYISQFINETEFSDGEFDFARGIAIEFCLAFVDRVDGIHVYRPDELSRGVMDDIERAAKMGKFVKFKEKYPWEE